MSLFVLGAVGVVVVVFVVVWVRQWLVLRALGRRVGWDVLPAPELDPSEQEVVYFGKQLVRARSAVHAVLLRAAAGGRVHLGSCGDGRVRYRLWMPREGRGVVPGAMFREVVLRRVVGGVAGGVVGPPQGLVPDEELLERVEDGTVRERP